MWKSTGKKQTAKAFLAWLEVRWVLRYASADSKLVECLPVGSVMFAPSTIAWAHVWSSVSAAALKASQISFRPSKAGAVSQNSSLLLRSWPSVRGISEVHGGLSFFSGWLRPRVTARKAQILSYLFRLVPKPCPANISRYKTCAFFDNNLLEYYQIDRWNWLAHWDLAMYPYSHP